MSATHTVNYLKIRHVATEITIPLIGRVLLLFFPLHSLKKFTYLFVKRIKYGFGFHILVKTFLSFFNFRNYLLFLFWSKGNHLYWLNLSKTLLDLLCRLLNQLLKIEVRNLSPAHDQLFIENRFIFFWWTQLVNTLKLLPFALIHFLNRALQIFLLFAGITDRDVWCRIGAINLTIV